MLAAAPAKDYAYAEFLLHVVLILWVIAVDVSLSLLVHLSLVSSCFFLRDHTGTHIRV